MKYFTREYVMGELDDPEFEDRLVQYVRYRSTIWSRLPRDVQRAVNEVKFHDAKIIILDERESEKVVELRLATQGIEDPHAVCVDLVYKNAEIVNVGSMTAAEIARRESTELLYYELDVLDGQVEQRFIVAPDASEFAIRFTDFEFSVDDVIA